jgi:hypothetical protein
VSGTTPATADAPPRNVRVKLAANIADEAE